MSAFLNALREEGTKEDCLIQIERLLDERAELQARLAEAVGLIKSWQSCGCPYCHGDCGSANPPVSLCIMRETDEFLAKLKGGR